MNADDAKKPAAFGLSKNVISMGTVSFLNDLSSDMIFPFIPAFITTVLGGSAVFVGAIEGVADATQSIVKIFSEDFPTNGINENHLWSSAIRSPHFQSRSWRLPALHGTFWASDFLTASERGLETRPETL